jgi:hypothetical protein
MLPGSTAARAAPIMISAGSVVAGTSSARALSIATP